MVGKRGEGSKIAVAGAGYVGLSNALVLAQNNEVIIKDIDERKVKLISSKKSPIADWDIECFLKSENLIQWIPGDSDFWQPQNIKNASGYGAEISFQEKLNYRQHHFQADIQYAYSISTDDMLEKQMIYVPYHKGNGRLSYAFKDLIFSYVLQYTGEVFTTTSNTQKLDDYWLNNLELDYQFLKKKLSVGVRMNNIFDKAYQSVAYRPMPGRNFEFNVNYKIN
jgi:iron complex outermembrane receptor protein